MNENIKFPVYKPKLFGNEKKYVLDCLDSNWISSKGDYVQKFEDSFKNYIGANYSTTVVNGTCALHLALLALDIGPGDEVILPSLTYIATANAIKYTGAKPVFVDSEKDTWQIDPEKISDKITNKTRAIICVHLYGFPSDLSKLKSICKEHNLFLVEDCAEALGTKYENKLVGTFGDISAFSFYGNKTITTGEGGMVSTNDRTLFDRCVKIKTQGLAHHREYWHDIIGFNYRMTNICAAIGYAQMENIELVIKRKREIAELYIKNLKNVPIIFQQEKENHFSTYWMVSILVPNEKERDNLREHLFNNGIETRPVFYPIHTMPIYIEKFFRLPVSENLGWRGINLPSYPDLKNSEIQEISYKIIDFFN